ncbi:hypothetical protein CALCODRAFT_504003 [Calocera cornea HHB12733]|uniref:Uncharacterized protein n=1 Tax=Calocera cornea HHB12733 TaxID=1353952 RepID=A0A165CMM5_9BASI|nr:hypothetical protein CALCODRAFT_504003 [Calocera cornea HHB12733]
MSSNKSKTPWASREEGTGVTGGDPRARQQLAGQQLRYQEGAEPSPEAIDIALRELMSSSGFWTEHHYRWMKERLEKQIQAAGGWAQFEAATRARPQPASLAGTTTEGATPPAPVAAPSAFPLRPPTKSSDTAAAPRRTHMHPAMCWCRLGDCPRSSEIRCSGECCRDSRAASKSGA